MWLSSVAGRAFSFCAVSVSVLCAQNQCQFVMLRLWTKQTGGRLDQSDQEWRRTPRQPSKSRRSPAPSSEASAGGSTGEMPAVDHPCSMRASQLTKQRTEVPQAAAVQEKRGEAEKRSMWTGRKRSMWTGRRGACGRKEEEHEDRKKRSMWTGRKRSMRTGRKRSMWIGRKRSMWR